MCTRCSQAARSRRSRACSSAETIRDIKRASADLHWSALGTKMSGGAPREARKGHQGLWEVDGRDTKWEDDVLLDGEGDGQFCAWSYGRDRNGTGQPWLLL